MSDKETAPPCRPYMGRLLKKLADPSEAFHYINAAWQESPEVFVQAVKDVAEAVRHIQGESEGGAQMSDKPWNPEVERIRKAMMERFSDKLSMEEVAEFAYSVAAECTAPEFWKKEALALVVLLRAKCSDEEWANMESRFAAAPAPQPSFWVIERFENGKSAGYWDGASSRDFVTDIEKAIHFCRREDAFWATRGWHWVDTEITEHCYLAATPQVTPTLVQGSWPKDCPQRHFVQGASWWQFHSQGSTMFASERDQAEAEAVKRFGPVEGTSEQADTLDDGFGNTWSAYCPTCKQKSMYVSGPGDARCSKCETEQASPTPEKCPTCGSHSRERRNCKYPIPAHDSDSGYHRYDMTCCTECDDPWHSSASTPKGTK